MTGKNSTKEVLSREDLETSFILMCKTFLKGRGEKTISAFLLLSKKGKGFIR